MSELVSLAQTWGPAASLIGFFVWTGWKREIRMTRRMDALEDQARTELQTLLVQTISVIRTVSESLQSLCSSLENRVDIEVDRSEAEKEIADSLKVLHSEDRDA